MLSDHDRCNLCICEGHHFLSFFTLEGVFKKLMITLTEKEHPTEPEASQAQGEPLREPEGEEPEEKQTCDFANSVEWTFKEWCKNSLAQAGRPPKP